MPRYNNQVSQVSKRRDLRRNLTEAEDYLWSKIRYKSLGYKFRRQHGVGPYILDFYCPGKKLAVELDGSQHNDPQNRLYDLERTEYLFSLGIKVLRFWNDQVFKETKHVLEKIYLELNS